MGDNNVLTSVTEPPHPFPTPLVTKMTKKFGETINVNFNNGGHNINGDQTVTYPDLNTIIEQQPLQGDWLVVYPKTLKKINTNKQ